MESCRVFFLHENAGDVQSCYSAALAILEAPLQVRGVLHSGRPRNELHIDRKLCAIGTVEKQRMLRRPIRVLTEMLRDLAERINTDMARTGPERNKHVCANGKP